MRKPPLSLKARLFAHEYLVDMNASAAYIRAGYKENRQAANQLLKDSRVQEIIQPVIEAREKKIQVDAQYVLDETLRIQKANIQDIVDDHGNIKDVSQWPEVWQRMVNGIEVEEIWSKGKEPEYIGRVKKVKMMNREKILEMLGKHVNIQAFADKRIHEHTGEVKHTHTEREARILAFKEKALKRATEKPVHH